MATNTAAATDYSSATLIEEWQRPGKGIYVGRDGWQVVKVYSDTPYRWVIVRPDGAEVLDQDGRRFAYRSALSAQLESAKFIRGAR